MCLVWLSAPSLCAFSVPTTPRGHAAAAVRQASSFIMLDGAEASDPGAAQPRVFEVCHLDDDGNIDEYEDDDGHDY